MKLFGMAPMHSIAVLLLLACCGGAEEPRAKHESLASKVDISWASPDDLMVHHGSFNAQERAELLRIGDFYAQQNREEPLGGAESDETDSYRQDGVIYIPYMPAFSWIYRKLGGLCEKANEEKGWGFTLDTEHKGADLDFIQLASYRTGGFYGAHVDVMWTNGEVRPLMGTRAIAVIMLLTDPATEYEGGRLHWYVGEEGSPPVYAPEEVGTTITWKASTVFHGVTEVTSGLRRVLVWWMHHKDAEQLQHDEL